MIKNYIYCNGIFLFLHSSIIFIRSVILNSYSHPYYLSKSQV
jgi:hypothetical protein